MRVLITGITGFAGSHLADLALSQRGAPRVDGFRRDSSRTENLEHLGNRITLHRCDLMNAEEVVRSFKKIKPDRIFHLAGQSASAGPGGSASTLMENFLGGLHVLDAARKVAPKARVLIVGSSQEYGPVSGRILLKETAKLKPAGIYGLSKAALDHLAVQFFRNHGLHVVRARPFNHTGPRQKALFAAPGFARQIARIEVGLQKSVIQTGDLEACRDFTDVRDVVRAYWLLLEKGASGEVYNVCSGRQVKIGRLLDICLEMAGRSTAPTRRLPAGRQVPRSKARGLAKCRIKIKIQQEASRLRRQDSGGAAGDSTKLRKATGWKPVIPLEKTLFDLLEYWREKIGRGFGSQ